ncbi:MAG: hypothetical protein K6G51_04310 [Sphaerochaetaceae bacterium]|nr:hypothetical protein [Sphaerochaetaceae bacterium]
MKKLFISLIIFSILLTVSCTHTDKVTDLVTDKEISLETNSEKAKETEYVIELDPQYNVPTEELLKSFPITYQTEADTELSEKIQNRMLNGFNRWNMGYEAWEHWGEVLYHKDSIYNVNGVRMTLDEYQKAMDVSLKSINIQMGNFNNMILVDDWMAIQYDIINIDRKTGAATLGTTMEFARFGDYGILGAKVDEGWGGSKNENYNGLLYFLTPEEREKQAEFMASIAAIKLPVTENLEKKYPIVYPTRIDTELGKKMKSTILELIDSWNKGYSIWSNYANMLFTDDVMYNYKGVKLDKSNLREYMKPYVETEKQVRINNILVSEDWAAIHFYSVVTMPDGTKEVFNHMQFLHFIDKGNNLVVDKCFAK